jgi:hypothetical protein
MFQASLAHYQETAQVALGILRACYVSWLHAIYQVPFVYRLLRISK